MKRTKIMERNEILPCQIGAGFCESTDSTIVWKFEPRHACALRRIRTFTGMAGIEQSTQTLIDHKNKMRLEIKKDLQLCDMNVQTTQYKDILITQESVDHLDPLTGSQVAIPIYVNSRDDYLSLMIDQNSKTQFQVFDELYCSGEAIKEKDMRPLPTAYPGRFRLRTGELETRFTCLPIKVTPRPQTLCYEELPVNHRKQLYFLNPLNRILTRHGTLTKCETEAPRAFKTIQGYWVATTPHLIKLPLPGRPLRTSLNYTQFRHQDLSQDAGIYTMSQATAKFEALEDIGLHKKLLSVITNSVCNNVNRKDCAAPNTRLPFSAFAPRELIETTFNGLLSRFLHIMNDIGTVASILVAVYLLTGLIKSIIIYLLNFYSLFRLHGCNKNIFAWSVPEVMASRLYTSPCHLKDIKDQELQSLGDDCPKNTYVSMQEKLNFCK